MNLLNLIEAFDELIDPAPREDIGPGVVTTDFLIPAPSVDVSLPLIRTEP